MRLIWNALTWPMDEEWKLPDGPRGVHRWMQAVMTELLLALPWRWERWVTEWYYAARRFYQREV